MNTLQAQKKPFLSTIGILFAAALCLLAGHLVLKEYMPFAAVGAIGFIAVAWVLYYVLFVRGDSFGFILVIFISSHFSYADNQGGLWNLMSFALILGYILTRRTRESFRRQDITLNIVLLVFVISNVAGWAFNNPMPILPRLLGAASFFGYLLMFRLVMDIRLSEKRTQQFLTITGLMLLYTVAVGLNQRYAFVNINTPLLGAYSAGHGAITYGSTNAQGTFRNSELFGEYSVLNLALFIPFLCTSITQRILKIRLTTIIGIILLCIVGVLITSTRSAAILSVFTTLVYLFVFLPRPMRAIDASRRQFIMFAVGALFIVVAGSIVGLGSLDEDLSTLADRHFSVKNIISGKSINRGPLVEMALNRIESESWALGFGYGVSRSNLWAWIGQDPARLDSTIAGYHNLYLSLPMIYGWTGSLAFLLLILITATRLVLTAWKYRREKTYLPVIALGFSVFWMIFIIDQYKISVLRNPNYHMLFWIWLGLSNAIVNTLKYRKTVAAESTAEESIENESKRILAPRKPY